MRARSLTAAVALVALLLAACVGQATASGRRLARSAQASALPVMGDLPAVGVPRSGGVITIDNPDFGSLGERFMLPVLPAGVASAGEVELIEQLYLPLYFTPDGLSPQVDYQLSLASGPPVPSDGDRVFTIRLKSGVKWSDGRTVSSRDVAFWFALMKAAVAHGERNWAGFMRGQLPSDLRAVRTPNQSTLVIRLSKPVNPGFLLYDELADAGVGVYALPSARWNVASAGGRHISDWGSDPRAAWRIYRYLSGQATDQQTFSSSRLWRVVDGPYVLISYVPSGSAAYDLVPNPAYSLEPKARAIIEVEFDDQPLTLLNEGRLDVLGPFDPVTDAGYLQRAADHGWNVFGAPVWGWSGALINFKGDSVGRFDRVIAQRYVRVALAELIDQPALIRNVFHGWAVPDYGPVPSAPASVFSPADAGSPAYPFDPARAAATLRAHGWAVRSGGRTVCRRPGHGPGQCGAGIPRGTPIAFRWLTGFKRDDVPTESEAVRFAAAAKRYLGVTVQVKQYPASGLPTSRYMTGGLHGGHALVWGVNNLSAQADGYYPTQAGVQQAALDDTGGASNFGGFSDPVATRLVAATLSSPSVDAVRSQSAYLERALPALYLPDPDVAYAVSSRVAGSAKAFLLLTQGRYAANLFYTAR